MKKIRKAMTRSFLLTLAVLMLAGTLLSSCAKAPSDGDTKIEGLPISHEEEFGGVYIKITIDDFNKLGFLYGDSVKVVFSNGYTMDDIPYFNGYYVKDGDVEEFDKAFPKKEKLKLPGQIF